jgi:hypothetical protein
MNYYTIQNRDVGRHYLKINNRRFWLMAAPGEKRPIQPEDVGKRAYIQGDILRIETDQQYQERTQGNENQKI